MIKIYQTKFGEDGDCFEACLASILEMDIKDVPHYKEENWYFKYKEWLQSKDLDLLMVGAWSKEKGVEKFIPNVFAIATGTSPRNIKHAVVYLKNKMVHDPHMSDDGLLDVSEMIYIIPKHY